MNLEYEVHNFDINSEPRKYEAIYKSGEALLVKVAVMQRVVHDRPGKPHMKWLAVAYAWAPGQSKDSDWIPLTHLEAGEMMVRDVVPHEADEELWLSVARSDAQKLVDRARVFAGVLTQGMQGKRRMKAA